MTGTIHPFPRRKRTYEDALRELHRPIVPYLDPAQLRRAIPDERPDLFETLRRAGYKRTALERLDLEPASFWSGIIVGAAAMLLLVFIPAMVLA